MDNYYQVLQVTNFAEVEVIKASYKALSKKYHPDENPNASLETMMRINAAYDVLSNAEKKKVYDEQLSEYLKVETRVPHENVHAKQETETRKNRKEYRTETRFLFFRVPLSLLVALPLGVITSYLIAGWLDGDGSWSFIVYTIYGALMGEVVSSISGSDSMVLGVLSAIITAFCIVFPFYEATYEMLPLMYGHLNDFSMFIKATKDVIDILLGSGFIRMIFVVLAPLATLSAISD